VTIVRTTALGVKKADGMDGMAENPLWRD